MGDSRDVPPREAARAYGRAGIAVLPLHYINKRGVCSCGEACKTPGKHPSTRYGVDDATTDDARICAWWDRDPNSNVGIAPGERGDSIWFALDIDKGERVRNGKRLELDGPADLAELERDHGERVPQRVVQISGSGARHVILRMPLGTRMPGKLSPAIDVIGPGKYIVAAPSNHLSGDDYEWKNEGRNGGSVFDRIGEIFDLAPLAPDWVLDFDPHGPSRTENRNGSGDVAELRALTKKTDLDQADFEAAVMSIPNKGSSVEYDEYMNVLFAIHFETSGSDDGFDLAHKWASQSDKYDPGDVAHRWNSIFNRKTATKTGKYIIMRAREYGWEPAPKKDYEIAIGRINKTHALVKFGSDIRVLREYRIDDHVDDLVYLKTSTFEMEHLPEKYQYPSPTDANPDREKPVSIGPIWLNSKRRRQYDRIVFEPDPKREQAHEYNLYRGFSLAPARLPNAYLGCSMLVDHIYDVVAGGDADWGRWIIGWLAQIVQQPWRKEGTALVLIGKEGVGKSVVGLAMKKILGTHHIIASDAHHILGNFNASLATAVFVQMEEAFWAGDKRAEGALKHLVTGETIRLEPKGVDSIEIRNYARILITTNAAWAVPAGLESRRFAVFQVLDTVRQDRAHFGKLIRQLEDGGYAAFLQYLLAFDLRRVDVAVIPKTDALLDQKLASLEPTQAFVAELLSDESDAGETVWPDDGPAEIEAGAFLRLAEQFFRARNHRWPGHALFVNRLKALLPLRLYHPRGAKRRYRLPTLTETRAEFNAALGQDLF